MDPLEEIRKRVLGADFVEKVLEARRMTIGERIAAGPKLFDLECERARQEIRSHNPQFTDEQVNEELRRRLAAQRAIDEAGIYRDIRPVEEELMPFTLQGKSDRGSVIKPSEKAE